MDFHLAQRVHPDPWVRAWNIDSTDPYVEICWGRIAKPLAARLVSGVAGMTGRGRGRLVSGPEIWRVLGEELAPGKLADDLLVQAAQDASAYGIGSWAPSRRLNQCRIEVSDRVPLLGDWALPYLDDGELAFHIATLRAVHVRVGPDSKHVRGLPDWVFAHAGFDSTDVDLADVQHTLFDRWSPKLLGSSQPISQAHARALSWLGGPDNGPSNPLDEPGRAKPDMGTIAPQTGSVVEAATERDPATEVARRRLDSLSRGSASVQELGL